MQEKITDKRLGNKFWTARSSHGRKPIFETPEILSETCSEYFEWCEENPLYQVKTYMYQGEVVTTEIPKLRAMTISGLCLFLDIDYQTWLNYENSPKKGFFEVTKRAKDVIYNQKFSGAAANLLNANIIARDLGLKDIAEDERQVSSKPNLSLDIMTLEEAAKAYRELMRGID